MMNFFDRVVDGVISIQRRAAIANAIKTLDGENIQIIIKKVGKRRSDNQNKYYWGVVIPAVKAMFEDSGTTLSPEDVHCFLKEHVGGMVKIILTPDNKRISIVETSTKLTTAEWENFMTKIRAWAAAFGCDIPEPNQEPPSWIDEVLEGQQLRDMRG